MNPRSTSTKQGGCTWLLISTSPPGYLHQQQSGGRESPFEFHIAIGYGHNKDEIRNVCINRQEEDLQKCDHSAIIGTECLSVQTDTMPTNRSDIGSGLNYKRKQFDRLMEMVELGQVRRIVIAHKDRLVRFGYGYFEAFCQQHNTANVSLYELWTRDGSR